MQIYYIVLHGKQDEDENKEKREIVIDGLKKYNRTILILKSIVVILSIFIISMWGKFIIERVKEGIELKENYEKGQYIFDIIDEAYCNINEIMNSDNYSLVEESTSVNYDLDCVYSYARDETLYKDGYFKEEYYGNSGSIRSTDDFNYTNYGVETQDKNFYIQLQDEYGDCSISISYVTYKNTYNILEVYHKENVLEYKDFEIREEKIDGKNYYIISKNENEYDGVYYTEIWINKDNMQLFKFTNEKIGCNKTELKITLSEGNVRDEDVRVKFLGEDEKIQELDKFFEKINNGELEDAYDQVMKRNFNDDHSQILFSNYVKPNKTVIISKEVLEIVENKYGMEPGYGYIYGGVVFDQNGDAYYVYRQVNMKDNVVQNIFVSIFGDIIKTNNIDVEIHTGDLVIL